MDDLIAFIEREITADEEAARQSAFHGSGRWLYDRDSFSVITDECTLQIGTDSDGEHIARHDPAHALRECLAKRRVLARHRPVEHDDGHECGYCIGIAEGLPLAVGPTWWPCPDLRDLVSIYVDRPGFRKEWKIDA